MHLSSSNSSGYKGVTRRGSGRFVATYPARDGEEPVSLGSFDTAVEAAVAYARSVHQAASVTYATDKLKFAAYAMRDGHDANQRGNFAAARSCFLAAARMSGGEAVAQISAANMALKSGSVRVALGEYKAPRSCRERSRYRSRDWPSALTCPLTIRRCSAAPTSSPPTARWSRRRSPSPRGVAAACSSSGNRSSSRSRSRSTTAAGAAGQATLSSSLQVGRGSRRCATSRRSLEAGWRRTRAPPPPGRQGRCGPPRRTR